MKTQKFEAIADGGARIIINSKTIIGAKRIASDWQSASNSITLYWFNGPEIAVKSAWNKKWHNF